MRTEMPRAIYIYRNGKIAIKPETENEIKETMEMVERSTEGAEYRSKKKSERPRAGSQQDREPVGATHRCDISGLLLAESGERCFRSIADEMLDGLPGVAIFRDAFPLHVEERHPLAKMLRQYCLNAVLGPALICVTEVDGGSFAPVRLPMWLQFGWSLRLHRVVRFGS